MTRIFGGFVRKGKGFEIRDLKSEIVFGGSALILDDRTSQHEPQVLRSSDHNGRCCLTLSAGHKWNKVLRHRMA